MAFSKTTPILRMLDEAAARAFYVGYLGFHIDWEHRFEAGFPLYMQVSRAGLVLHLTEHHGDACPGSTVFVRVSGLREYHAEISAKGYGYLQPGVQATFHGSIQMEVIDPSGNRIRFDEMT